MTTPQIIRTIEELKELDPVDMCPIVAIATDDRVRAACKALEEAWH